MMHKEAHDKQRIHCMAAGKDGFLYSGGEDKVRQHIQILRAGRHFQSTSATSPLQALLGVGLVCEMLLWMRLVRKLHAGRQGSTMALPRSLLAGQMDGV